MDNLKHVPPYANWVKLNYHEGQRTAVVAASIFFFFCTSEVTNQKLSPCNLSVFVMASAVWRSWTQSSNLTVACAHSKYRTKTLQEKRDILQEVDAALLSKQEIAKEHTIPKRTLSKGRYRLTPRTKGQLKKP